jgi:hypothetical protein
MEPKSKQPIKVVEITASWGSPLQKQAGEAALRALLLTWQEFYSEKHQRNHIKIAFPTFSPPVVHEKLKRPKTACE